MDAIEAVARAMYRYHNLREATNDAWRLYESEARAAIARYLECQWRPMEEAPRDGQCRLYCDAHENIWIDVSPDGTNGCGYPPVAWQPLPAPPENKHEG